MAPRDEEGCPPTPPWSDRKRKLDDTAWYEGLPALKKQVTSGFRDKDLSDFTILCKGKTFHAHKLVLQSLPFFNGIIKNDWKESRVNVVDLEEDDPKAVEMLLAALYGANLRNYIPKLCDRPVALDESTYADDAYWRRCPREHENYIPSLELVTLKGASKDPTAWDHNADLLAERRYSSEPIPQAADQFCKELLEYARLAHIADKYCATDILEDTRDITEDLLIDCYTSPKILDVARQVFEWFPNFQIEMAEYLARGLGFRMFFYAPSDEWTSLVEDFPRFAQKVLLDLPEYEYVPHGPDPGTQYCPRLKCRRNVMPRNGVRCPECHYECLENAKSRETILTRRSRPVDDDDDGDEEDG